MLVVLRFVESICLCIVDVFEIIFKVLKISAVSATSPFSVVVKLLGFAVPVEHQLPEKIGAGLKSL